MSKKKTSIISYKLFLGVLAGCLLADIVFFLAATPRVPAGSVINKSTKYGNFLAAQHAVYVNDFEKAAQFTKNLADVEYKTVKNTRLLSEFLSGKIPENIGELKSEKSSAAKLVYDAYLVQNEKWDEVYNRHINNTSPLYEPIRIWSGVAKNRITEALKRVDMFDTTPSWKAFIRGQIYAETGKTQRAAEEFQKVSPDFMNINDYIYIMSFYNHYGFNEFADQLRRDFTSSASGLFMLNYNEFPDWSSVFAGPKASMAFNVLQNISHTQILLYTDLSVLMLRFADSVAPESKFFDDSVNYFIGRFLFNTAGNYEKYFAKVSKENPYHLFADMLIADESGSIKKTKEILRTEPLFISALNKMVAYHIQQGERRSALRVINRALDNDAMTDLARSYLMQKRTLVNFMFGDFDKAQSDLDMAKDLGARNEYIVGMQARIWAAQETNLDEAYHFVMAWISKNPSEVYAWDVLGQIVSIREGNDAALEIYERIGAGAQDCSLLFEHLGDAYVKSGKFIKAREAYKRAIDLSDDGLVIIKNIEKKLKKIKEK